MIRKKSSRRYVIVGCEKLKGMKKGSKWKEPILKFLKEKGAKSIEDIIDHLVELHDVPRELVANRVNNTLWYLNKAELINIYYKSYSKWVSKIEYNPKKYTPEEYLALHKSR